MARDILNGVKPKSSYNHTSSKPYNPHYLARQFGLMQGIPFPYESFAKFDEWANLYTKELANQEMSSNKRISNFYFEKFKIAPQLYQNLPHGWRQCSSNY